MAYDKLIIDENVLTQKFFPVKIERSNEMWRTDLMPKVIFMKWKTEPEPCFVIIDSCDCLSVVNKQWYQLGKGYVGCTNSGYLHRVLVGNASEGRDVHHRSHRFDNRSSCLEAVSRANHDRHRTYTNGDLRITENNIANIRTLIG